MFTKQCGISLSMARASGGHVCRVPGRILGGTLGSGEGVVQRLFVGKGGVRQITNSAEERKTLAEGGFIHYI